MSCYKDLTLYLKVQYYRGSGIPFKGLRIDVVNNRECSAGYGTSLLFMHIHMKVSFGIIGSNFLIPTTEYMKYNKMATDVADESTDSDCILICQMTIL